MAASRFSTSRLPVLRSAATRSSGFKTKTAAQRKRHKVKMVLVLAGVSALVASPAKYALDMITASRDESFRSSINLSSLAGVVDQSKFIQDPSKFVTASTEDHLLVVLPTVAGELVSIFASSNGMFTPVCASYASDNLISYLSDNLSNSHVTGLEGVSKKPNKFTRVPSCPSQ